MDKQLHHMLTGVLKTAIVGGYNQDIRSIETRQRRRVKPVTGSAGDRALLEKTTCGNWPFQRDEVQRSVLMSMD